jgi:hypothetical protein
MAKDKKVNSFVHTRVSAVKTNIIQNALKYNTDTLNVGINCLS